MSTPAKRYRTAITGIGLVSPVGNSYSEFWDALQNGVRGIRPIQRIATDKFRSSLAGEASIGTVDWGTFSHEMVRMDRFTQYAVRSALDALATAHFTVPASGKGGIFAGLGMGGLPNMEAGVEKQNAGSPRRVSPYLIPSLIPNMAGNMIAMVCQLQEPVHVYAGACAGGLHAIGAAHRALARGEMDWALAGGTEAVITPITFSGFEAMRALDVRPSPNGIVPRPFDRDRKGMIVGEGAAFFLLEKEDSARARGARQFGMISGYGTATEIQHLVEPMPEAFLLAMEGAIKDAGLAKEELSVVFAHASGLVKGDHAELAALRTLTAPANRAAITSIKSYIGHTFGASGCLSMAAALGTFATGILPAIPGLDHPDPEFEHMNLAQSPRNISPGHSMVNAFGFGGIYSSMVVSPADN